MPDSPLQIGLNVSQKNQARLFRAVGKLRLKTGEHIQMRVERVRDIQIVFIAAKPAKRLAVGNNFQIGCIDVVLSEHGPFFGAEIPADDGDDRDISKKTG